MLSAAPELILDYASPMARTPLRLASRSIISIVYKNDEAQIHETLTGQTQALAAIIFSGLTVLLLGSSVLGIVHRRTLDGLIAAAPILILYFLYAAGTLFLILAVIHTSWRQTVLGISHQHVTLNFKSPLKKTGYDWPTEEIRHVHVVQGLDGATNRIVFQLRIEIANRQIAELFGGHTAGELTEIAWLVREYMAERK